MNKVVHAAGEKKKHTHHVKIRIQMWFRRMDGWMDD